MRTKDLGADFWGKSRLHAYATANIVDLQLLLAGLAAAAAVLRCSFLEVAFCLRHQTGRTTRVASFPHYCILSCVVTSHRVNRSRHDREKVELFCTYTDLDSRQGKVLGISSWGGVQSTPAERLSSLFCPLRI
jgi:hypothetical protein